MYEIGTRARLRAVSYCSLQSYCMRNLSRRAAKPRAARNDFAIALDEIRTRRILREKADCKQSKLEPAPPGIKHLKVPRLVVSQLIV